MESKDDNQYNIINKINRSGPFQAKIETASAGGEYKMDDSTKVLFEYLEQNSREREARYHQDAQEREHRYRQEMLEQDRRLRQESKEREERIIRAIQDLKQDLKTDISELKRDINSDLNNFANELRNTKNNLTVLSVTTILGVATMVVGALIALFTN